MGIFDRESQTATMERPKTETPKMDAGGMQPGPSPQAPRPNTPNTMATAAPMGMPMSKGSARPTFKIRWTSPEGEIVSEYMMAIPSTGKTMGTLHIPKPDGWQAGHYKLEFLLNDMAAATMDFEVR